MSNELTNFNNRPTHIVNRSNNSGLDRVQDLVSGGVDYPTISKSNNRHYNIKFPGGEVAAQKPEELPLVFLKVNQVRSFYAKKYTPDSDSMPDCMSHNGVYPDKRSPNPQSTTCKGCKHNVFDETREVPGFPCAKNIEACVVPAGMLSKTPSNAPIMYHFRMTVADYKFDRKNPDQTNFLPYIDMLNKNNVGMEQVVTRTAIDKSGKFRFDKSGFTFMRWLEPQEIARAQQLQASDECDHILGLDLEPLKPDELPSPEAMAQQPQVQAQPQAIQTPPAPTPVQQPQPQASTGLDDLFGSDEPTPQPQAQLAASADDDFFNSLGGDEQQNQKPVDNTNMPAAVNTALDWLNS